MESKSLCETSDKRFALLIDADNVSARYLKPILNELSKYGTVTIKRIYGDWTLTLHAKWKDALLENSITPIQQFGYTQGKNATDSAMIIDAMDILYTDNVDGFCLVSSDSDFTRLASRLRESGRTVIGMGEKKTPVPFRRACDVFTTLELLVQNKRERSSSGGSSGSAVPKDAVEQAVVDIITDNQNNGKATGLGEIGSRLQKRYPDFDVRSYGTNLLSKLLEEFTRVTITKDHSSVTVELSDGPEEKSEKSEKPEKSGRASRTEKAAKADEADKAGKTGKIDKADKADKTDNADKASRDEKEGGRAESSDAGETPEKASRRTRSHRATRRVTTKVAGHLSDGGERPALSLPEPPADGGAELAADSTPEAASEPAADVKPGRRGRADRKARAEAAEKSAAPEAVSPDGALVAAAETSEAPEAPEAPEKPKRTRKKAAAASAEPAPAPAATEASEAPEKPKKAKRARKPSAPEKPEKPEKPKRAAKKTVAVDTPEAYIRQMVEEAGADGIMLSTITDRLRARFKDFKVRDLGYSQMRQYMAATGTYDLEKSGRNFRVRLA